MDLPASDGWVQPNGNVLLAVYPTAEYPKGGVVEIDRHMQSAIELARSAFGQHGDTDVVLHGQNKLMGCDELSDVETLRCKLVLFWYQNLCIRLTKWQTK